MISESGEPSWLGKLKAHLTALSPRGEAIHQMLKRGVPASAISREPALGVIVNGSEGGTGGGGMLPLAITLKWLSSKLGLWLHTQSVVISGHYRPEDGQEQRKSALSHTLDLDLEEAISSRVEGLEIPLGPNAQAMARGKLFQSCYLQEAADRLRHNEHAVVAVVARTLRFQYFSRAAFELEKSRNNVDIVPTLRSLAEIQVP